VIVELLLLMMQHSIGNEVINGGVMDGSAGVGCPGVVRVMLPIAQLLNGTHTHLIHYL
jgi:hypothetical protein